MAEQPRVTLNDGRTMPQLGYGVWQVPNDEATTAVTHAIAAGYRSIDTAAIYGNEEGVGAALKRTDVPRDELFITTKVWNSDQGYDSTLRAFDQSARRLGLDAVDLYLIHWPRPRDGRYLDTWRALVRLQETGRARSIGVSNFTIPTLERIIGETGVTPVLNQIEVHPDFQQRQMRAFHEKHGIFTESWSPLGEGKLFTHPVIRDIAEDHAKTPAQIVLRWHLDNDLIVIPKSVTPERIRQNIDVFDFMLEPEDLERIAGLDDPNARTGADPETAGF